LPAGRTVITIWLHSEEIVKVDIVPIGNSRGIRIPKALLEQCGFGTSAEIVVEDDRLVVSPTPTLRKGWDDAFRRMAERRDDGLLDTPATVFDEDGSTW
jgi:antitoxin MazE